MRRSELIPLISSIGIKTVYGWYEQGQEPKRPYAVLNFLDSADVAADNINYMPRERWQVDLITSRRDEALEKALQDALRDGGLFYSKTQEADSVDGYVRMIYRFTTLGGQ